MKTKRRARITRLRFRKNDPDHNLLAATQAFVIAHGGGVVVIGGIEVQDWQESPHHYRIAVRCLGRRPMVEVEPTKSLTENRSS